MSPSFPEKVKTIKEYEIIIDSARQVIKSEIETFLSKKSSTIGENFSVDLSVNTKDTVDKKYFALWGTALSKGDVGAVGRGNRQQGFISGLRPSTNEAVSGKNPNHFAGIVCQLVAEKVSKKIYNDLKLNNVVYITANNGDSLNDPSSIDVIVDGLDQEKEKAIACMIENTLQSIDSLRSEYIEEDPFVRFMRNCNE